MPRVTPRDEHMIMSTLQKRSWLGYFIVWAIVGAVYASMMTQSRPMFVGLRPGIALMEGIGYVVPVAILGVGVWHLTRWIAWPPRNAG